MTSRQLPSAERHTLHGQATADVPGLTTRPLVSRARTQIVHGSLVLFALAIVARSVQVQLVDRALWEGKANEQHIQRDAVAPLRGQIRDASGSVLVESRELVRFGVDPKALDSTRRYGDARVVLRRGLRALGVKEALIRQALQPNGRWTAIPGLHAPSDVKELVQLRAVRSERVLQRYVNAPVGIQRLLGTVGADQRPQGGLELEADSLLRGVTGLDEFLLDGRRRRVLSPSLERVSATPGHTIVLTLNRSLQQIIERQLAMAMDSTGASGGDVVVMDPRDGAVLAMAGARNGKPSVNATGLTEPYEPGSVMKPFLVGWLLDHQRTALDEVINTEGGKWRVAKRTIDDEHKASFMSLRDVIRFSSNIGVAKLAERVSPREQYELLRDFGFGTYTGVPYPAESRGRVPRGLREDGWTPQTPSAMAMGYEVSATPVQIAAAYAALANGGELLQPALIREVQDANGVVVFQHSRRVLRRVLTEPTVLAMRGMLRSVVDSGTAVAASLETYDVAGKSGTAKRAENGVYVSGGYNSTFAAMFPAQAPQLVVVAKLIDPKGRLIFGGVVAGSLVRGILQEAQSSRNASLDLNELSRFAKLLPAPQPKPRSPQAVLADARDSARFDSLRAPTPTPVEPVAAAGRVVVDLPLASAVHARAADSERSLTVRPVLPVPSVYGLDLRQAARTLSHAGFRVQLSVGTAGQTQPAAGVMLREGSTVQLFRVR